MSIEVNHRQRNCDEPPPRRGGSLANTAARLLAVAGCWTACVLQTESSPEPDTSSAVREWACGLAGSSCVCEAFPAAPADDGEPTEFGVHTLRNPTDACLAFDCCLLQEAEDPTQSTCSCLEQPNCAAEAASRPGSVIVSQCPPEAEDPTQDAACAAEGQSCRGDYLRQNGLADCCRGTTCKVDAGGVPACRAATSDEQAFALECAQQADSHALDHPTSVSGGVLRSNIGMLDVSEAPHALATLGTAGCFNALNVSFRRSGTLGCDLDLDVGIRDGALRVYRAFGSFADCPGYTGTSPFVTMLAQDGDPLPVDVTFTGAACVAGSTVEWYCTSGVFDFFLHGAIDSITFEEQHLLLQGSWCGPPTGGCPAHGTP